MSGAGTDTRIGQPRGPAPGPKPGGGAPKGSQNAAQPGRWRKAIERALENMAKQKGLVSGEYALDGIAMALLKASMKGDMNALRELGNRLDGLPKQEIEHSGGVTVYKPNADDAELG